MSRTSPYTRTASQRLSAIADYALIGDCRTAALVSRAGSIDWLCLPDFSSPSIFAGLLDPARGGSFSLRPRDPFFTASRRYVERTAVLETDFTTESGSVRLLDLMPIDDGARSLRPMREVLRAVEGMDGTVEIEVRLDLRPDYARRHLRPRKRGRLGWAYVWGNEVLVVRSDIELRLEGDALVGTVVLGAGERRYLSLAYTKSDPAILPPLQQHAEERIAETIHWWREWAGRCRYEGPYREAGGAQRRDLEAPHLYAVGRDRRGADDVAARGDRQGPQLGLPLLLAARRRPHHAGAAGDWAIARRRWRSSAGCCTRRG